jgi:hypothetical protein
VFPLVLLRLIFLLESFCCREVARPSEISVSSRYFGRLWIFTLPIHSSACGLPSYSICGHVSSVSRQGLCASPVSFAALAFSLPLTIVPPNLIAQFCFLQSFSVACSSAGQGHRALGSWVTSCFRYSALSLRGLAASATRLGLCLQCIDFLCGGYCFIDFIFLIDCGLLQVKPGCVLELPDQKARGFLVLIALNRLFLEHAHKVFGEMPVRT